MYTQGYLINRHFFKKDGEGMAMSNKITTGLVGASVLIHAKPPAVSRTVAFAPLVQMSIR